jgi:hypothetical protein
MEGVLRNGGERGIMLLRAVRVANPETRPLRRLPVCFLQ